MTEVVTVKKGLSLIGLVLVAMLALALPAQAGYYNMLTGHAVASVTTLDNVCPDYCVCATDEHTGRNVILDCQLPEGCVEGEGFVDCTEAGGGIYAYRETTPRPSLWVVSYDTLTPNLKECVAEKLDECGFGRYKSLMDRYIFLLSVDPNEYCAGMDCDSCAEALMTQLKSSLRLAPWVEGNLDHCLGGGASGGAGGSTNGGSGSAHSWSSSGTPSWGTASRTTSRTTNRANYYQNTQQNSRVRWFTSW